MTNSGLDIRETGSGLQVRLHVLPRAKRNEMLGIFNGALKIKITAPPVDDAANRAIISYFSTLLSIPKSSISLPAGSKSRDKILQIRGLSLRAFLERLSPYMMDT
jgi:uncharacterized protein